MTQCSNTQQHSCTLHPLPTSTTHVNTEGKLLCTKLTCLYTHRGITHKYRHITHTNTYAHTHTHIHKHTHTHICTLTYIYTHTHSHNSLLLTAPPPPHTHTHTHTHTHPIQSANSMVLGTVALSSMMLTCFGSMISTSSHTTPLCHSTSQYIVIQHITIHCHTTHHNTP